jgi:hypothetical protein
VLLLLMLSSLCSRQHSKENLKTSQKEVDDKESKDKIRMMIKNH